MMLSYQLQVQAAHSQYAQKRKLAWLRTLTRCLGCMQRHLACAVDQALQGRRGDAAGAPDHARPQLQRLIRRRAV